MRLDDVQGFVLDVDGTLVHRDGDTVHVQPGAREALERIRASGRPLALFTNGSHAPPSTFAEGLRAAGLDVDDDELLTPLRSVLTYLREHDGDGSVLLFATDAARDYLVRAGLRLADGDDAGVVFVAHVDEIAFPDLERAARAVMGGAALLTGSFAPAYAGANGPIISRGAMTAAAIAKASGRRPVIVGKPSRAALRTVREQLGVPTARTVVIGDDTGMDIALGRLGGARTILVRSGISGAVARDALPAAQRPDAVVDGIADLVPLL